MQNRSHSLDILKNDDQPHTNEVTYFKNHSADTYEGRYFRQTEHGLMNKNKQFGWPWYVLEKWQSFTQ